MITLTAGLLANMAAFSIPDTTPIQVGLARAFNNSDEIMLEQDIPLPNGLIIEPLEEYRETINLQLSDALIEKPKLKVTPVTASKTVVNVAPKPVTPKPVPVKQDVEPHIQKYAGEYGLSADKLRAIGHCESGLRPEALSSNGLYGGIYQFVSSTWVSNRNAMGLDPNPELRFNAEENIKTAAFKMSRDGYGAWPVCGKRG